MVFIADNRDPSKKDLAIYGLAMAVLFTVVGSLAYWKFDSPNAAKWIWGAGALFLLVYLAIPKARGTIFRVWVAITFPLGLLLSHLVLALSYYLVFCPIGLIMRVIGRDAMNRKMEPGAKTYWTPHRTGDDPARYFKQF